MYRFYLDSVLLPVAPSTVKVSIRDYNETVTLIDGNEAVFPKKGGSREYSFTALLPNREYPFAIYGQGGFKNAKYYTDAIEGLKKSEKEFMFVIERETPDGRSLFDTCINTVIGALSFTEGGNDGADINMSISLKEYIKPMAKKIMLTDGDTAIKQTEGRSTKDRTPESYTVKKGDSLWRICKTYLGDGERYRGIAELNGIKNPNLIYPGQVIRFE